MKPNILQTLLLTAAFGLLFAGCDDDESAGAIYIPDAGTAVKANFYIEDEPYVHQFNVAITASHYPQLTPVGLPNDVTVALTADLGKVAEYNEKNGTDYTPLPEAALDLTPSVVIKAGESTSAPASITLDAKNNIQPFTEYLLPVSIASVDGADADNCCQTIYFIFRGSIDASNMELFSRSKWKVLEASSEEPREGEWGNSGLKEACIDGDNGTFWSTAWNDSHPQPPHWIVIDMNATVDAQGLSIRARREGSDAPKEVTVELSDDNENWTVAAKFKDIPSQGEYRSFFPAPASGRYLKVTITAVSGGPHVTVGELALF